MKSSARLRNYLIILLDTAVIFLCFYIVLLFGRDNAFQVLLGVRKIIYVTIASTVLIFLFTDMYKDIFKKYKEIIFNCSMAGIVGIALFYIFVNIRVWHSGAIRISYLLVMLLLISFLSAERILVEILYRFFMKTKGITIIGNLEQSMRTGYEFIKNKEKTHEIKYICNVTSGLDDFKKVITDTDIVIVCPGIEKRVKDNIVEAKSFEDLKKAINAGKLVKAYWCGDEDCEESVKDEANGAKTLNMPFDQSRKKGKCVYYEKETE